MQKPIDLDFVPTTEQQNAIELFKSFVENRLSERIFIISGAAGTGKTTLMYEFIQLIKEAKKEFKLAAPTGRAARILSTKTTEPATTLHSLLYTIEEEEDEKGNTTKVRFVRRPFDFEEPQILIIDEASMIGNELDPSNFMVSDKPLLEDLIDFFLAADTENKIVFVGDRYQLPPVGSTDSPALSSSTLKEQFETDSIEVELTEVKRQEEQSDVLYSARLLREAMEQKRAPKRLKYHLFDNEDAAVHHFIENFDVANPQNITFVAWRNEDVYRMNIKIRNLVHNNPTSLLQAGDLVLVNRTYMDDEDTFLANGEIGQILQIRKFEEVAGLEFATAEIRFESAEGYYFTHETKVLLDTLKDPSAKIDAEKSRALYGERIRKNKLFRKRKDKRFDRYLNAIQLKYGYSLTCHKAQGGEWNEVIIHPKVPPKYHQDHARWLYTAVTRAKEHLYSFRPNA